MWRIDRRTALVGFLCFVASLAAVHGCKGPERRENVLTYALSADITSLDPVRVTEDSPRLVSQQVMETLVTYDAQLHLQPLLAESWQMLEGGRKWVFRLRPEIQFQDDPAFDGKARFLNASDVVYSLQRVLDPKTQTLGAFILSDIVEGAGEFSQGSAQAVSGIIAKDARTIEFKLTKPYALFPARLSLPFCAIVPHEAVEKYGSQFGTHPVGSGAFQFASWDLARGKITLKRNPHYWSPLNTNLDGLDFVIVKSEASQLAGLTQGRIDAFEADPTTYGQIVGQEGNPRAGFSDVSLVRSPSLTVHFIGFNFQNPVSRDLNFRLACNYAIDKQKLSKFVLGGLAVPSNGPLLSSMEGGDDVPLYPQDIAKAHQLIAASPYRGQNLVYVTDNSVQSVAVAEFIQNQLAAIGVRITIDKNSESIWVDKLTKGNFDLGKLYFAFDYPSPDSGLSQFLKVNLAPAGPNFLHYASSQFDRMYDAAVSETDTMRQAKLFAQLQSTVRHDAPWIFLYSPIRVVVVRDRVQGLRVNGLSFSLFLDGVRRVPAS